MKFSFEAVDTPKKKKGNYLRIYWYEKGESFGYRFFEHLEIFPPLEGFVFPDKAHFRLLGNGSAILENDIWQLSMKSLDDGIGLEFKIHNPTEFDWPPLCSLTACLSIVLWGTDREIGSPTFDNSVSREKTFISTPDGPYPLTGRYKHFFDRETPASIRALPYPTNVFRVPQHVDSSVLIDRGLVGRVSEEWVLGYGWENCLNVNANNPMDCLHPTLKFGPLPAGGNKKIRGKIFLFPGDFNNLCKQFDTWKSEAVSKG